MSLEATLNLEQGIEFLFLLKGSQPACRGHVTKSLLSDVDQWMERNLTVHMSKPLFQSWVGKEERG